MSTGSSRCTAATWPTCAVPWRSAPRQRHRRAGVLGRREIPVARRHVAGLAGLVVGDEDETRAAANARGGWSRRTATWPRAPDHGAAAAVAAGAGAFGGLIGSLPLLFLLWPALQDFDLLGVPVPVLVLAVPLFPLIVVIGLLYQRRADALDETFRDVVTHE